MCRFPTLAAPCPSDRDICGLLARVRDNPVLHHGRAAATQVISGGLKVLIFHYTHPLKKGLVVKINIRLLTLLFGVIYQAGHDLWCPVNDGWENFAQLQIFEVKFANI